MKIGPRGARCTAHTKPCCVVCVFLFLARRTATLVLVLALVASAEAAAEWKDTELTTKIWQAVSSGDSGEVKKLLDGDDDIVKIRSADGRGALWWAYEADNDEIIDMLIAAGADKTAKDVDGKTPMDMSRGKAELTEWGKKKKAEEEKAAEANMKAAAESSAKAAAQQRRVSASF